MTQRPLPALFAMALAIGLAACLALAPATARAAGDGLVEGRDYVAIPGGRPLRAEPGKVEVVEVFAYWCHVCNDFQPHLTTWQRRLPADVAFRYLPAAFTRDDAYARAYFAAESLGALARTHEATYRAIHAEYALPQRGATADEVAGFLAGFDLERGAVAAAMRSPAVDARMDASRDFIVAAGVQGTPTMIVDGRYRVIGRSFGDMLRITDLLVARLRAAAAATPASTVSDTPDESTP